MDLKLIRDLMSTLEKSKLHKLSIREKNGFHITLEKESEIEKERAVGYQRQKVEYAIPKSKVPTIPKDKAETPPLTDSVEGTHFKSPMVGTFYQASSPEASPFVKKNTQVKKGDVLCIIEAMKVMNEVKSEVDGTVTDILIKDGDPVEFGQTLFVIK